MSFWFWLLVVVVVVLAFVFFVAVVVIFAVTVLPTGLCFGSLFFLQMTDELVGQCMLLYTRVIAHQDQKWQAAVRMRKVKHHPGREAESYGLEVGQIFPVFHVCIYIYLTQMSLPLLYQESVSLFSAPAEDTAIHALLMFMSYEKGGCCVGLCLQKPKDALKGTVSH